MSKALSAVKHEDDLVKRGELLIKLLAEVGIDRKTVDGQPDAIQKLECAIRFSCAAELGLTPGRLVMYNRVAPLAPIQYVNSTGFVKLTGVDGEWNPKHLILVGR